MWLLLIAAVALVVLLGAQQTSQAEAPAPPTVPPFPAPSDSTVALPSMPVVLPGDNHDFDNQIVYAAQNVYGSQFGGDPLAPLAIKAIIWKEQGRSWVWDANAVGDQGCSYGLMQVNICANPQFDAGTLLDPNQNILAGSALLAHHYQAASGDWYAAIRSYNGAGPQAEAYAADVFPFLQSLATQAGLRA